MNSSLQKSTNATARTRAKRGVSEPIPTMSNAFCRNRGFHVVSGGAVPIAGCAGIGDCARCERGRKTVWPCRDSVPSGEDSIAGSMSAMTRSNRASAAQERKRASRYCHARPCMVAPVQLPGIAVREMRPSSSSPTSSQSPQLPLRRRRPGSEWSGPGRWSRRASLSASRAARRPSPAFRPRGRSTR